MPKYLVQTTLSADALKVLQKDKATGRRAAVAKAVESLGGKLEGFYYSLGDYDVVGIVDMPDLVSLSAVAMALSGSGLVRTHTTALLTVEETDRAVASIGKVPVPGR
jgi:uncharacterized protein with GYD domain